jgi:acetylornithine/N-succinyldiaminopimelate aminotransferase
LKHGLVINVTAESVVRLLPPLIFKQEHADHLITTLAPLIRATLQTPVEFSTQAKAA